MSWKDPFPIYNRYFETETGILYCGDFEDVLLDKVKENSVDSTITDPPYGVRKKESWDDKENFISKINLWLSFLLKVSKSYIVWFCASKMLPYILRKNTEYYQRLLVWDKPAGSQFNGASHNNIWYSLEPILIYEKEAKKTEAMLNGDFNYSTLSHRTIPFSEWGHPTTKPLTLINTLLYHYSLPRDIILDPFAGSGTTLISAEKMNRRWIGVEKEEKYCKIIVERLKEPIAQRAFKKQFFGGVL